MKYTETAKIGNDGGELCSRETMFESWNGKIVEDTSHIGEDNSI